MREKESGRQTEKAVVEIERKEHGGEEEPGAELAIDRRNEEILSRRVEDYAPQIEELVARPPELNASPVEEHRGGRGDKPHEHRRDAPGRHVDRNSADYGKIPSSR